MAGPTIQQKRIKGYAISILVLLIFFFNIFFFLGGGGRRGWQDQQYNRGED